MNSSLYSVNISLKALENNIALLTKDVNDYIAVIKADAYGHGLCETAKAILSFETSKKLHSFAVGNVDEAVELRDKVQLDHKILALLGALPYSSMEIQKAKQRDITLLVHNKVSLQVALENNLSFAVKWNTGMNRFGFNFDELPEVLGYIKGKNKARFELNLSHLATAEELSDFEKDFVESQIEQFSNIANSILEEFPKATFSFGQSANILNRKPNSRDIVRLGLAMYGVNPLYNTDLEEKGKGLKPVMSVKSPILAINTIEKGQSLGYGQRQNLEQTSEVAIVGIGYADGYRRQYFASKDYENKAKNTIMYACYQGRRIPLLGSVCMQVAFFDVSGLNAKLGDEIYLLGGENKNAIKVEELSAWWGTIPYEPLCTFGKTIQRKYI